MARGNTQREGRSARSELPSESRLVGREIRQMRREIKAKDFSLEKASKIPELKFLADPAFKDVFEASYEKYTQSQVGEEGVFTSQHIPDSIFIERDGKTYEIMFPEIELSWSRYNDPDPEESSYTPEGFYRETVIAERTQDYLKKNGIVFAEGSEREGRYAYSGRPTLMDFDKSSDVKVKIPWDETKEWHKLNITAAKGLGDSIDKFDRIEVEPIGLLGQSGRQGADVKYIRKDGKVNTGYSTFLEDAQRQADDLNKKIKDVKDFKRKYGVE